jgi:hypothetical protein
MSRPCARPVSASIAKAYAKGSRNVTEVASAFEQCYEAVSQFFQTRE